MELSQYNHSLQGKILTRENTSWSCNGRWYKDEYIVEGDHARGVRQRNFWTSVEGKSEDISDRLIPIDVVGDEIHIAGVYVCDRPADCVAKPMHTCQEPFRHVYHFLAKGKKHTHKVFVYSIAEANRS